MTEERIHAIRELLKTQKYDLAEQQLEQYLQLEPGDWDAKILLGTCYMFQGNMQKAKSLYMLIQNHLKSEKNSISPLVKFYLKISAVLFGSAVLIASGLGAWHWMEKEVFPLLGHSLAAYAGPPVDYYCKECGTKTSIGWGWIRDEKIKKELEDKVSRGLIPCEKCKKDTCFSQGATITSPRKNTPPQNNDLTW